MDAAFRANVGPKLARHATVIGPAVALALLCAALAMLIDVPTWVDRFGHPGRQPPPEVTWQGARLLRIMLIASAVALVAVPLVLVITAPSGSRPISPRTQLG